MFSKAPAMKFWKRVDNANNRQMQDTIMSFDATNTWLFDSWENAHNSI
jgi:hypothetical protein